MKNHVCLLVPDSFPISPGVSTIISIFDGASSSTAPYKKSPNDDHNGLRSGFLRPADGRSKSTHPDSKSGCKLKNCFVDGGGSREACQSPLFAPLQQTRYGTKKPSMRQRHEGLHPAFLALSLHPRRYRVSMGFFAPRQVFWLSDRPTLCAFPFQAVETVAFADFVPDYSGGTAPDFNGISY
jgi:hypothetical protein